MLTNSCQLARKAKLSSIFALKFPFQLCLQSLKTLFLLSKITYFSFLLMIKILCGIETGWTGPGSAPSPCSQSHLLTLKLVYTALQSGPF